MSNSPGLVNFAIALVMCGINLPNGQVLFFGGNSNYRRMVINPAKGWTILFLRGGVGQLPKKNSCIAKVKKKKSCTVGQGKKKFEQAFLLVGSC